MRLRALPLPTPEQDLVEAAEGLFSCLNVLREGHAGLTLNIHGGADEAQTRAFLKAAVNLGLSVDPGSAMLHGDNRWINFDKRYVTLFCGQHAQTWDEQVKAELEQLR